MCWWMIQSDQLLLFEGYHDTSAKDALLSFWRATGLLRLRSLDILPLAPLCDLSSQDPLGRVLSAQEFFLCDYTFWPTRMTWSHWLGHWLFDILLPLRASSSFISLWSGGASLHRDEERLSGLWGRFLAWPFSFLPVRLTRFHQDLGWLSCLRSPTFRHLYIVTRVSQDFTASVVYCYVILCVIGASFSLIECASCHRYLEPNGFSAPILLSLCTIDDLTPERFSRLWRTLPRRINLFSNLFD